MLIQIEFGTVDVIARVSGRYNNGTGVTVFQMVQAKVLFDQRGVLVDKDDFSVRHGHYGGSYSLYSWLQHLLLL
jgi:hypothetical protein